MAIHQLDNPRPIERALADLIEALKQYNPGHPRAIRLAAMIAGLRKFKGERPDHGVGGLQAA